MTQAAGGQVGSALRGGGAWRGRASPGRVRLRRPLGPGRARVAAAQSVVAVVFGAVRAAV